MTASRAIRTTGADTAFQKYIRERDDFTCRRCRWPADQFYPMQKAKIQVLYLVPPANPHVRFDLKNAIAACLVCHLALSSDHAERHMFFRRLLGEREYVALMVRSESRKRVRLNFPRTARMFKKLLADLKRSRLEALDWR